MTERCLLGCGELSQYCDGDCEESAELPVEQQTPRRYYASEEAICSTCGRHVDLCHPHDKREDQWKGGRSEL